MVVVATIVYAFLKPSDGFVNVMLKSLGMDPVSWYNTPGPWPFILVLVHTWKGTGYSAVIYLAVISGISSEYYEEMCIRDRILNSSNSNLKSTVSMCSAAAATGFR